jgi:hypothetical protein
MVAVSNSFEGGTNTTTISAANSGGASGNAFDLVSIGAATPFTFDNTQAAHGSLSAKIAPTASSTTVAEWNTSVGTQTEFWGRAYVYLTGNPASTWLFHRVQNAGTNVARIALTTGRLIRLDGGSANTALFTAATALPLNAWCRIEWHILVSATVGQLDVRIFRTALDGTTADESSALAATQNLGAQATQYQFGGVQGSATPSGTFWFDDVAISTVGWIGPTQALTSGTYGSITTSTGWTPTGGTVLGVISDGADGTLITSSANPSALLLDGILTPAAVPAGDLLVTVKMDKVNATTGTMVAKLYDGVTLRATVSGVAIPNTAAPVPILFPAASISAVTGWATGVRLTLEATAS